MTGRSEAWPPLVELRDGNIVITVAVSAIPTAAEVAFEEAYGEDHGMRVTDPAALAREMLNELRREEEDGTTPVMEMLDKALIRAVENGVEGVECGE